MNLNRPGERRIVDIGVVSEFTTSAAKWFLLLNLGIGWILFWGNLVRLHLSMGDFTAAIVTIALFIGPLVVAMLWWIFKRVDSDHITIV